MNISVHPSTYSSEFLQLALMNGMAPLGRGASFLLQKNPDFIGVFLPPPDYKSNLVKPSLSQKKAIFNTKQLNLINTYKNIIM